MVILNTSVLTIIPYMLSDLNMIETNTKTTKHFRIMKLYVNNKSLLSAWCPTSIQIVSTNMFY